MKEYYSALNIPSDSFKLQLTNKEELFKVLSNVDPEKAYVLDEIPCRMLKDSVEILAEPISQIFNMWLGSKFPEGSRTVKVRLIFKEGKNKEPKNYRPVSLSRVKSKVIERVVHNQWIEHLKKHKIIFDYQSCFRSKHSVNTCLAHLSNQILKGLEPRKSTGIDLQNQLIDLRKAFDTLDHQILLKKLRYIGFSSENVRWFESYLKNRNFVVSLIVSLSEPDVLNCGVPQGSTFGPILFVLYVNDMKSAVTDCDLRLYSDGTCLLFSSENVSSMEKHLNVDFNSLSEWFIDNKLSMHLGEDKTKCILFKIQRNSSPPQTSVEAKAKSNSIL